jgi:hypothetical protein
MAEHRPEYERLLGHPEDQVLPPPQIPGRAKKSIAVAFLLCFLGGACFVLFLGTFLWLPPDRANARWPFFILGLLAVPSGARTLYLAWQIYHRAPGYNWPMIFL